MTTIGIIAEFNPFHNGHKFLIEQCKKDLGADRCIVIMSGDFVQRGAPAITDKFTRAKMALQNGADICLELPIYYALGSAEYFASGAVSILNGLECVDYLCFGSECGDLNKLGLVAEILNEESDLYKAALTKHLKKGSSFAGARQLSVLECADGRLSEKELDKLLSSPNNILAIEYIRALLRTNSKIKPYTIVRRGEEYHSEALSEFASASAIRNHLFLEPSNRHSLSELGLTNSLPESVLTILDSYKGSFAYSDKLSQLLLYKLLLEKDNEFTGYLDVTEDLSNKIVANINKFTGFDDFCHTLKSKDIAYSRISRVLLHILLNIKSKNMEEYKKDNYTAYCRILGMKKGSDIVGLLKEKATIPVIARLTESEKLLSGYSKRLFDETLRASRIYSSVYMPEIINEYRKSLLIEI